MLDPRYLWDGSLGATLDMIRVGWWAYTEGVLRTHTHTLTHTLQQHDLLACAEQLDRLGQELGARMEELKDTVQAKTAVPTAQVYVRQ